MADKHWYGQIVFTDAVTRDEWYDRFKDYMDAEMAVREYPHDTFAAGLEKQTHIASYPEVQGPAFSFSMRLPETHLGETGTAQALWADLQSVEPQDGMAGNATL